MTDNGAMLPIRFHMALAEHAVFQYQCPGVVYFFEPWAALLDNRLWPLPLSADRVKRPPHKKRKRRK